MTDVHLTAARHALHEATDRMNAAIRAAKRANGNGVDLGTVPTVQSARLEHARAQRAVAQAEDDAQAEGLWWHLEMMGMDVLTATEPDVPDSIHQGLSAAQSDLDAFLRREYFGVIPGGWDASHICWVGYQTIDNARREESPIQTREI